MSKIIRIDITDDQRRRAKELYDFNVLNKNKINLGNQISIIVTLKSISEIDVGILHFPKTF